MSNRTKLPKGTRKTPIRKLPAWARKDVEDAIERLLAVLNEADGDPDLENDDPAGGDVVDEPHDQVGEGNDEPSLGSVHALNQERWPGTREFSCSSDLEFDGETAPSADSEPSQGSGNFYGHGPNVDQRLWAEGIKDDREGDHDGDEPSLGSLDRRIDQTNWTSGMGEVDAEEEHDGREPDEDLEEVEPSGIGDETA